MTTEPIWLREKDQPKQANTLFMHKLYFEPEFLKASEEVLRITLENELTQVRDRRALWLYLDIIQKERIIQTLHAPIGTTFPSFKFGEKCRELPQEKTFRARQYPEHLSSYPSRNPSQDQYGGSAKLVFNLNMGNLGIVREMAIEGACSGLKEWEDLGQFLAPFYYLELISFKDQQVQEILRQADESVKNDPTGRPEGMTITGYVAKVFAAIDTKMGR